MEWLKNLCNSRAGAWWHHARGVRGTECREHKYVHTQNKIFRKVEEPRERHELLNFVFGKVQNGALKNPPV